jgi:hypothetical protein
MSDDSDNVVEMKDKTHSLHIALMIPATVTLNGLGEVVQTTVHGASIAAAKLKDRPVKAAHRKEIEKRREQLVIVTLTAAMKAIMDNYNERKREALMQEAKATMENMSVEEKEQVLKDNAIVPKEGLIQKVTGFFNKKE